MDRVVMLRSHPVLRYLPSRYHTLVNEAFSAHYEDVLGLRRRVMPNGMRTCPLEAILSGDLLAYQGKRQQRLSLEPDAVTLAAVLIELIEAQEGVPVSRIWGADILFLIRDFNRKVDGLDKRFEDYLSRCHEESLLA